MDLAERFESRVDRRHDHHLWTGYSDPEGTPQIRVNGKLTTARRVAWELAHGEPLTKGQRVHGCVHEPRCVRIEHLSVDRRLNPDTLHRDAPLEADTDPTEASEPAQRSRRARGTGSIRSLGHDRWQLTITADGARRYATVTGTRTDAETALRLYAVEAGAPDATMAELVDAYLAYLQRHGRTAATLNRYRQLWRDWLAPTLASIEFRLLRRSQIEAALQIMHTCGQSPSSIHQAAVLLNTTTGWAHDKNSRTHPHAGIRLPDGTTMQHHRHRQ